MASVRNFLVKPLALAGAILLAACGNQSEATAPLPTASAFEADAGHSLVECPTETTHRARGTIGLLGGTISAGGTSIKFPPGAVLTSTEFELIVPASRYMEIEAHAVGRDHYTFLLPVSVSLDVSRCPRSALEQGPLTVFHIDERSKSLLEDVGGILDLAGLRVHFQTGHFSGYAIAD